MTATSFDDARHADPYSVPALESAMTGLAAAAGSFEAHVFAEYAHGQLISRYVAESVGSDASYRMIRLVEGHLPGRVVGTPFQVPHGIAGLEGRALVVVDLERRGTRLGVVIGSSGEQLGEHELAALQQAAEVALDPIGRSLEEIHVSARDREGELTADIARALADSSQLPKLIPIIARSVADAAGFDRGTLLLWRPDGELNGGASEFATGQPDIRLWGVFRAMHTPIAAIRDVLESGEHRVYEMAEDAPDLEPDRWVRPFDIKSVLIVPLIDRGEHIGVVILDSETRTVIDHERVRAARRISDHGAMTIGIARMVQRERASRQRTQLVLGTVVQAATQMNTSGVLTVIAEGINAVLSDSSTVAFVLRDNRAARLAICGRGDGAVDLIETLTTSGAFPDGDSPFLRQFSGPVQLNAGDGRIPELRDMGIGRVLVVPVRRASRELGWVVSYDRSTTPYLEDDLKVVAGIAAQAALSLHTASLLEGERATVARLEELDRLKTAFVAAVSHELRTPLTAIVGFSEILAEQLADPVLSDFLEDLRREAAVLESLIGNLLDTSRLEAGLLQLNLQDLDIRGVIADAAGVVGHGYKDREIRLELPERLAPVIVDQVRIRQVLVNLLENAAKYSPPGSPIEVRVRVTDDSPPALQIRVEDHGNGIPSEHRDAIFQRFHRLATHQSKPGTGIGLYLVKALIDAHGGQITVGDRVDGGPGASFVVSLPMAATEMPVGH